MTTPQQVPKVPPFAEPSCPSKDPVLESLEQEIHRKNVAERDEPQDDFMPIALSERFQNLLTTDGPEMSAPSVPSSWSSKTPSVPESASQLLAHKLSQKDKQLQDMNAKLELYRKRFEAIEAKISSPAKRERSEPVAAASADQLSTSSSGSEDLPPPRKKPSPEPAAEKARPEARQRVRRVLDPLPDLVTISPDMSPPSPVRAPSPPPAPIKPKYLGLRSIICAFREGGFTPGEGEFPFQLCADLLADEIKTVQKWNREEQVRFLPMIIAALKLIYPSDDQPNKWESRPFSKSPSGAAKYWIKVLRQWTTLWLGKALAVVPKKTTPSSAMEELTTRIRNRIKSSTRTRADKLGESSASREPAKPEPIIISDSDSEAEAVGGLDDAHAPAKKSVKLAPGPESYTRAEMKTFAKMARAIRNTSDSAHVPATANFLDAEFSDNSGRAARVLSSQFAWKRNRFKEIANKAAKIMEDRVRLFNKGDAISDEAKKAKLKRESKKMNDLFHLIYWSDVGREGAKYFEQLLQQKKIAKSLNATISGEISVEKAQKMIAKAIEVQKKADAARAAKLYKAASSSSSSRSGGRRRVSFKGGSESYRPTRVRRRGSYPSANRQPAGRPKASGRGTKRAHSGSRA